MLRSTSSSALFWSLERTLNNPHSSPATDFIPAILKPTHSGHPYLEPPTYRFLPLADALDAMKRCATAKNSADAPIEGHPCHRRPCGLLHSGAAISTSHLFDTLMTCQSRIAAPMADLTPRVAVFLSRSSSLRCIAS